jgi:hypothetical protein
MFEKNIFYFLKIKFEQVGCPENKRNKNKIITQVFKKSGEVMLRSKNAYQK